VAAVAVERMVTLTLVQVAVEQVDTENFHLNHLPFKIIQLQLVVVAVAVEMEAKALKELTRQLVLLPLQEEVLVED